MAYEIEVVAPVTPSKDVDYINECCRGGDVLRDRLLPKIRAAYPRLITCQEDFGWIIWARDGKTVLATDIFADDPDKGEFRIHLSSRVKRWVLFQSWVDVEELESLKEIVLESLQGWATSIRVQRWTPDFMTELEPLP